MQLVFRPSSVSRSRRARIPKFDRFLCLVLDLPYSPCHVYRLICSNLLSGRTVCILREIGVEIKSRFVAVVCVER